MREQRIQAKMEEILERERQRDEEEAIEREAMRRIKEAHNGGWRSRSPTQHRPTPIASDWTARADGKFTKWTSYPSGLCREGCQLYRNKDNYVVQRCHEAEDEWLGRYNPETNTMEDCDIPEEYLL